MAPHEDSLPWSQASVEDYNASIMLALNVPDKYAMKRMGYSTPATLKKVYQHTMKDKEKEVTSTINSQMSSLFSGNAGDSET